MRYVLRPADGVQVADVLPTSSEYVFVKTRDAEGDLYVAVCDFCGGNCGQCGTSVGTGVPFNFDRMAEKGGWKLPGWGFYRKGR